MNADRREDCAKIMTPLTLEYEKNLEALQDKGLAWQVLVASPTVFEVYSRMNHRVDLEHWTCTCQRWHIYGFPRAHALIAIRRSKRQAIDFISPYFTSDYFKKTYMYVIQLVPNYNWPNDIDEDNTINPSIIRKQPSTGVIAFLLLVSTGWIWRSSRMNQRRMLCALLGKGCDLRFSPGLEVPLQYNNLCLLLHSLICTENSRLSLQLVLMLKKSIVGIKLTEPQKDMTYGVNHIVRLSLETILS
ncbi:hypothetical protein MKW98_003277 [Papaver atlanticum]|uniref:Zinc finger PMZ-type domain-containing protein n=1 Tax=Papaver atlanticum TaxID=357466 RepID=A0AAD4T880_9MAGN|nr:hypothetical protein MKW98_003277 [Papaver atlanticum]